MNDETADAPSAFGFSGSWREYAPIAFTNLLLTIVTLGVYTFWARARTRRYLWSHTRFIDDRLQWTGTGLELFVGYLLAIVLFFVPLGIVQLILQGILLRGHAGVAILLSVAIYVTLLYLVGVAIFRALRYRLSRTFWHGIRGGSDDGGFAFGWSYLWRTVTGWLALGLMVPWAMTRLWNQRWSRMSFGPLAFRAEANWRPIFPRYLLFYFSPAFIVIALTAIGFILGGIGMASGLFQDRGTPGAGTFAAIVAAAIVFYLIFFVLLGVVALVYYSAFFREGVGKLRLGDLEFAFTARTRDWLLLYLGNLGVVLATLGIGYIFVPYRNWVFFVRHAEVYGEIHLDTLTQSATRDPGQGEGLLDAFDVGAF